MSHAWGCVVWFRQDYPLDTNCGALHTGQRSLYPDKEIPTRPSNLRLGCFKRRAWQSRRPRTPAAFLLHLLDLSASLLTTDSQLVRLGPGLNTMKTTSTVTCALHRFSASIIPPFSLRGRPGSRSHTVTPVVRKVSTAAQAYTGLCKPVCSFDCTAATWSDTA